MVYRSRRRKSRKLSGTRKTHRQSKRQTSRRRKSRVRMNRTKSRRRKSIKKSRRRKSIKKSRRKRSNSVSRRSSPRQDSTLLLKETRLRFNFSSNPTSSTKKDKLVAPLVIFGMNGCPGCDNAKKICNKKGIKFSYHLRKDNEKIVNKVAPGYRYVPVIVNRFGKFIGGSDKLQEYTKNMPDVN